jgi:hypothetical protein
MKRTFVVTLPSPTSLDSRVSRLLSFSGIEYTSITAETLSDVIAELQRQDEDEISVVLTGSTLAELLSRDSDATKLLDELTRMACALFITGWPKTPATEWALKLLSSGKIGLQDRLLGSEIKYAISSADSRATAELTGFSFSVLNSGTEAAFNLNGEDRQIVELVAADGHPFLVRYRRNAATVWLSAALEVADITQSVGNDFAISPYFSRVFPLLMFAKAELPDAVWRASTPSLANLIIDDPLLRPDYGFLNFEALLAKSDELGFTATIAFIPWNYRRSIKATIELFRRRIDRLAICIHGCDHGESEFTATDLSQLNLMARNAIGRMEQHQQRNGLTFTKAMVFPQGRFCAPAMLSLKCNGYMAAVNTDVIASPSSDALTMADFLDVAITKYYGFPLYRRRYPERRAEFPFMMFLGQPLFLVEHHGFFKGGYSKVESLIEYINQLPVKPKWTSLSHALEHTYKVRRNNRSEIQCRIFSTRQIVHNPEKESMDFVISRFEPQPELVEEVRVDGLAVKFDVGRDSITTSLTIQPQSSVQIECSYRNHLPLAVNRTMRDRAATRLRRHLSEFRDNVIARNDVLLSVATVVKQKFLSRPAITS